jgi:hypothetical protein
MRVFSVAAVVCGLWSSSVSAGPNDLHVDRLVSSDPQNGVQARQGDFRLLSREVGVLITPALMQPAETTGIAGFEFAADATFQLVNFNAPYWQDVIEQKGQRTPITLGARARKGFILPIPLTSEIEMGAQWLVESQLVSVGGNVRVALNEGFRYAPDIAIMAGVNRLVGDNILDLVTATTGATISKGFSFLGTFQLCPFAGYQAIFVSGLIDAGPQNSSNVSDNVVFETVSLTQNRLDRASFGVRIVAARVLVSVGTDINFVALAAPVVQPSLRFGLSF